MAENKPESKKAKIELLDESKEYTIIGLGKEGIEKDVEYLVSGQTANTLIGRGLAKLK